MATGAVKCDSAASGKNPVSRHEIGHRVSQRFSPAENAPETRSVVTGRHGNRLDGFFPFFLPFVF
jgi:hypothetical protein